MPTEQRPVLRNQSGQFQFQGRLASKLSDDPAYRKYLRGDRRPAKEAAVQSRILHECQALGFSGADVANLIKLAVAHDPATAPLWEAALEKEANPLLMFGRALPALGRALPWAGRALGNAGRAVGLGARGAAPAVSQVARPVGQVASQASPYINSGNSAVRAVASRMPGAPTPGLPNFRTLPAGPLPSPSALRPAFPRPPLPPIPGAGPAVGAGLGQALRRAAGPVAAAGVPLAKRFGRGVLNTGKDVAKFTAMGLGFDALGNKLLGPDGAPAAATQTAGLGGHWGELAGHVGNWWQNLTPEQKFMVGAGGLGTLAAGAYSMGSGGGGIAGPASMAGALGLGYLGGRTGLFGQGVQQGIQGFEGGAARMFNPGEPNNAAANPALLEDSLRKARMGWNLPFGIGRGVVTRGVQDYAQQNAGLNLSDEQVAQIMEVLNQS